MTATVASTPAPVDPPGSTMAPAIEVRGLTKVYGPQAGSARSRSADAASQRPAAKDVNFTVGRGEFFVIMGLSGSGKSTVLRMLNRLVEPTSGEVLIDGQDITRMRGDELRAVRNQKINMVFQHFALFPHRTVRENAGYALHVRGESSDVRTRKANEALRTVGLEQWGDSLPSQLSGGMRQRVGLARALASEADILLMDEPFSALDPLIRHSMQDLLMELQHKVQRTVVFVTHDLNEAMRLGDRIMIMRDGEVVQLGTGPQILSQPADDYVRDFIADVDRSRVLTTGAMCEPPLVTASIHDDPAQVLARLQESGAGGAHVLGDDGRVCGTVSVEEISSGRASKDGLWYQPSARTITADKPLSDAAHLVGHDVVPLAVVDDRERFLGVLPRATLLSAVSTVRSNDDA